MAFVEVVVVRAALVALLLGLPLAAAAGPEVGPADPEISASEAPSTSESVAADPLPAEPEAAPTPAPRVAEPVTDLVSQLVAIFRDESIPLDERVRAVRAAALDRGVSRLDPLARVLLLDAQPEGGLARAEAAVALAPTLPDAHLALARARLVEQHNPGGAIASFRDALVSIGHHLDAALWFEASFFLLLAAVVTLGGLLFLLAAGLAVTVRPASLLQGALGLPAVSAWALVGALLLLPAACGEGVSGVALAAGGLAIAFGPLRLRFASVLACALVVAGLHPLAERAGAALAVFAADPVAVAVHRAETGPGEPLAQLRVGGSEDPLARRAQALAARRAGQAEQAVLLYAPLLAETNVDATLLNNAAAAHFATQQTGPAIALFERAAEQDDRAEIHFNLAQAYGRAIRLEDADRALTRAQALAPETALALGDYVGQLGRPAVADLPFPIAQVRERLAARAPAPRAAARLRAPLAPGLLAASLPFCALVVALTAALGFAVALRFGERAGGDDDDYYGGIARLLQGREATDPALRVERMKQLRERRLRQERIARALALLVPGAAGVLARRSWLGLLAALGFAAAGTGGLFWRGVLPDALAAGATGSLIFASVAIAGGLLFVLATGFGLVLRERS